MIQKPLQEIKEDDLIALVENQVREGRTIEYKRELPAGNDASKKEFLADVSSFSNTAGGDLIFGVAEEEGLPREIAGLRSGDLDAELLRLENILDTGIEPRIRRRFFLVRCSGGKDVLIVRIERSWSGPHRVCFQQHDKFCGRNDSGKYRLDLSELRSAFTLSSNVNERIRGFRTDRLISISNNETPAPLKPGPKLVLHCVPVSSFASQSQLDVIAYFQNPGKLPVMGSRAIRRLNLEGVVVSDGDPSYLGENYTHLYRTGIIEVVSGPGWTFEQDGNTWMASARYERELLSYLPEYLRVLTEMDIGSPFVVGLAITNARGLRMWNPAVLFTPNYAIDRETLVLPEVVMQDLSLSAKDVLKPMFDLIWNACGYPSSQNFDESGNWMTRR